MSMCVLVDPQAVLYPQSWGRVRFWELWQSCFSLCLAFESPPGLVPMYLGGTLPSSLLNFSPDFGDVPCLWSYSSSHCRVHHRRAPQCCEAPRTHRVEFHQKMLLFSLLMMKVNTGPLVSFSEDFWGHALKVVNEVNIPVLRGAWVLHVFSCLGGGELRKCFPSGSSWGV